MSEVQSIKEIQEEIVEELAGFSDKIEAERSKKREFASEARDLAEQVEHLKESLAG